MALKPPKPSKIARNRRKVQQRQQTRAEHQLLLEMRSQQTLAQLRQDLVQHQVR